MSSEEREHMTDETTEVEAHRLAANVNEDVVGDDDDVEGYGGGIQSNEAVVEDDDDDVQGHGTDFQSNETVTEDD